MGFNLRLYMEISLLEIVDFRYSLEAYMAGPLFDGEEIQMYEC